MTPQESTDEAGTGRGDACVVVAAEEETVDAAAAAAPAAAATADDSDDTDDGGAAPGTAAGGGGGGGGSSASHVVKLAGMVVAVLRDQTRLARASASRFITSRYPLIAPLCGASLGADWVSTEVFLSSLLVIRLSRPATDSDMVSLGDWLGQSAPPTTAMPANGFIVSMAVMEEATFSARLDVGVPLNVHQAAAVAALHATVATAAHRGNTAVIQTLNERVAAACPDMTPGLVDTLRQMYRAAPPPPLSPASSSSSTSSSAADADDAPVAEALRRIHDAVAYRDELHARPHPPRPFKDVVPRIDTESLARVAAEVQVGRYVLRIAVFVSAHPGHGHGHDVLQAVFDIADATAAATAASCTVFLECLLTFGAYYTYLSHGFLPLALSPAKLAAYTRTPDAVLGVLPMVRLSATPLPGAAALAPPAVPATVLRSVATRRVYPDVGGRRQQRPPAASAAAGGGGRRPRAPPTTGGGGGGGGVRMPSAAGRRRPLPGPAATTEAEHRAGGGGGDGAGRVRLARHHPASPLQTEMRAWETVSRDRFHRLSRELAEAHAMLAPTHGVPPPPPGVTARLTAWIASAEAEGMAAAAEIAWYAVRLPRPPEGGGGGAGDEGGSGVAGEETAAASSAGAGAAAGTTGTRAAKRARVQSETE